MPERSEVFQIVNIGNEGTAGQAAASFKRLMSLRVEMGINVETDFYTPMGYLHPTVAVVNKEWSEADISGPMTYNEIPYLLCGHYTKPAGGTAVIPSGGTTSRYWSIVPGATAAGTPATYTVEGGDAATRAQKFLYGIIPDFGYSVNRDEVTVTGRFLGQKISDGITPSSATEITLVPTDSTQWDIYVDTTSANLGTTKLTRLLEFEYGSTGRYGPLWTVNSANASWVVPVDLPPDTEVRFLVEADSEGMNLLGHLRGGTTLFVRAQAQGGTIEAGTIRYRFRHDMAIKLNEPAPWGPEDGVYAIEYTGKVVYDSTYTRAEQFEVINTQGSL